MKKSLLFLLLVSSLCFLNACGSAGGTVPPPPPPLVATHFSVTAPASATAGTAVSFMVTALDTSNNVVTNYAGTVNFTSTDSQAMFAPLSSTLRNGTGTFSVTLKTSGQQTITATDATALAGTSGAINVSPAASTHFSIALANDFVSAGTAFQFSVTAIDGNGNTVTSYTGTVHFSSSDGQAALPANSMLPNGVGNFSGTLKTLGRQTISVVDTSQNSINGTSNVIYVSGPATHFSVGNTSGGATTRGPITLIVTALDVSNNLSTGYSGTVKISSSDRNAILPANGPLNSGLANFQFTFETSGNQTITATDTVTLAITGASSPIAVTASAPLAISSGNPPNGTVGSSYGPGKTIYERCPGDVGPGRGGSCVPCVPNTFAGCGSNLPSCGRDSAVACIATIVYAGFELTGAGGIPPYSWSASSLPPGLAIKIQYPETLINGTPTPGTAATYQTKIMLNDSGLPPAPFSMTYSVVIDNPPPPVVNAPLSLLPGATINQPFSYTFSATGGLSPYQNWSEMGTLPVGIAPITSSGVLAGTPTVTGTFPISVTVEDSLGQVSAAQDFEFQVYAHGFKPDGAMGAARTNHTATLLADGTVLLAGGLGLASAERYDPGTAKFMPTTGSMSMARSGHTATLLTTGPNAGKVLITGGQANSGSAAYATAELFDPGPGTFTLTIGSMSVARTGHNATLLSDGTVLITGGGTATAELFDPRTGIFTTTKDTMTAARSNDTATLLANGKVLITGGFIGATELATAELYDPVADSFAATGPMTVPRGNQTATLLNTGANSGKVLIAGGNNIRSAELYDPTGETFSSTGPMATARAYHDAILLGDGTVLMVGGFDANNTILSAVELYNPTSGTYAGTGGLQTPRAYGTATLLKDGTVLVTGGVDPGGMLATAELYQ